MVACVWPFLQRLLAMRCALIERVDALVYVLQDFQGIPGVALLLDAFFVFTDSALAQNGFPLGSSRMKVTVQGETRQVDQPREQTRQCNYCTG